MAKKKIARKIIKKKVLRKVPRKKPGQRKVAKKKAPGVPGKAVSGGRDGGGKAEVIHVDDMYSDWFIDYASYVILERAVPSIHDGLKPVQRRILHTLKEKDDGRYNKVANLVGHTMQYHPHGDASIADAMVSLGQKNLLIDTQGNWGNILTGDKAAGIAIYRGATNKIRAGGCLQCQDHGLGFFL